jgi:hypothetical protein
MKKVTFGKLKRKNYKGIRAYFRRLLGKQINCWVVSINKIDVPVAWDPQVKIDQSFEEKEVGVEFNTSGKKPYVNIVTFYPDVFKKMYPDRY